MFNRAFDVQSLGRGLRLNEDARVDRDTPASEAISFTEIED